MCSKAQHIPSANSQVYCIIHTHVETHQYILKFHFPSNVCGPQKVVKSHIYVNLLVSCTAHCKSTLLQNNIINIHSFRRLHSFFT